MWGSPSRGSVCDLEERETNGRNSIQSENVSIHTSKISLMRSVVDCLLGLSNLILLAPEDGAALLAAGAVPLRPVVLAEAVSLMSMWDKYSPLTFFLDVCMSYLERGEGAKSLHQ